MKQLLLLGGTAWLGSQIVNVANDAGWQVTCVARGESGAFPPMARAVRADRSLPGGYAMVAEQDWDLVVDVTRQPGQARTAVRALATRARRWIFVSTISVYADHAQIGQHEGAPLLAPWHGDLATVEHYGEAKVACEQTVQQALGDRALIVRPGLIVGPGDPSDRFGYWPGRFALAGDGPVLVPRTSDQLSQVIDVRDLARWIVVAGQAGVSGVVNAVGASQPLDSILTRCAQEAGFAGRMVWAGEDFLTDHRVQPWSGPRSLPLWMPGEANLGFGTYNSDRFIETGGRRRDLTATIADVLADERGRGLDRPRRAGLTRGEELELIADIERG